MTICAFQRPMYDTIYPSSERRRATGAGCSRSVHVQPTKAAPGQMAHHEGGRHYAIMMAGHTTPEMEGRWGDYGCMAAALLREEGESWDTYYVCDGQLPTDEQLQQYQGVVITGSKHDAHGEDEWIVRLREFMACAARRKQRLLGICFGCQLLAIALGGRSGRSGVNELGTRVLEALPALGEMRYGSVYSAQDRFPIVESHQDAVFELPQGGVLLAKSKDTPFEMWAIEDHVLGIQGHPEFSADFSRALLQYRLDSGILTPEQVSAACRSLEEDPVTPSERDRMRQLCIAFLKH